MMEPKINQRGGIVRSFTLSIIDFNFILVPYQDPETGFHHTFRGKSSISVFYNENPGVSFRGVRQSTSETVSDWKRFREITPLSQVVDRSNFFLSYFKFQKENLSPF